MPLSVMTRILWSFFQNCVSQFAKNATCARGNKVSWAEAQRELLVNAYIWLLYHYDRGEAHHIHHNIIVYSLFWLAFAKSVDNRSRPGCISYNPVTWLNNMAGGRTAMNSIGDPLTWVDSTSRLRAPTRISPDGRPMASVVARANQLKVP